MTVAYAGLELRKETEAGKDVRDLSTKRKWLTPESGDNNPGRALRGKERSLPA